MLRREILQATSNVLAALKETGVASVFSLSLFEKEEVDINKIIYSYSIYIKFYNQFSDSEKHILSISIIETLSNFNLWNKLIML